jgi:hypothetical protein
MCVKRGEDNKYVMSLKLPLKNITEETSRKKRDKSGKKQISRSRKNLNTT